MANKLSQNLPDWHQTRSIELRGFGGLSLKVDTANRPPTSWQQLDNCDLFVDGSVRSSLGWAKAGANPLGAPYEAIFEYRQTDSGLRQMWGYCGTRAVLDRLDIAGTPVPLVQAGIAGKTPWIGLLPGIKVPYNIRKWFNRTAYATTDAVLGYAADGQVYIFQCTQAGTSTSTPPSNQGRNAGEPAWPLTGTVSDGTVVWTNQGLYTSTSFAINYAVIVCEGAPLQKFDGSVVTLCGISSPQIQVLVRGLITASGSLSIQFGRYYAWTWFNPTTLIESSPSPVIGPVQNSTNPPSISINGCYLPPGNTVNPPPYQSYQQVELILPNIVKTPPVGSGFTHVRFYATLDGGSTLFLVPTLCDSVGNIISDPNSSVRVDDLISTTDILPIPGLNQPSGQMWMALDGAGTSPVTTLPTPDATLTLPGPLQSSNEPPPVNPIWGTIYHGSLYLVDSKDRVRLYYMNPGSFETRGINNYLDFPSKTDAPIMTFVGTTTYLIVSTSRGIHQVTGSSPADFQRQQVDFFHGFVGKQMLVSDGTQMIGLIAQGIVSEYLDARFVTEPSGPHLQVGFSNLSLVGNDVQPLVNPYVLDVNAYSDINAALFDTIGNQVLFLLRTLAAPTAGADMILGMQLGGGFYRLPNLPTGAFRSLAEISVTNETNIFVYASDMNGQIWRMQRDARAADQSGQTAPVMMSQVLPTPEQIDVELQDTQKVFRYLWVRGVAVTNWLLDWSLDGGVTFAPATKQPLVSGRNGIGATAQSIVLRLTRSPSASATLSLISYLKIDYEIVGRTQN